ncbi:MAG: hypothetical protein JRI95_15595 [Deltaproteobacteria bacterium]|nr:hypothetical protein [Deltaproteobacteria bacterium]
MKNRGVSLARALKDPRGRDFEAEQLEEHGRIYIYRYVAEEEVFLRATMPSGAAAPVFRRLGGDGKVPVDGWVPYKEKPISRPRLIRSRET